MLLSKTPLGIGLFPTADAEHNTQDFHQDSSNQSLSPSCFDSKAYSAMVTWASFGSSLK
jgi:hypothetical protein